MRPVQVARWYGVLLLQPLLGRPLGEPQAVTTGVPAADQLTSEALQRRSRPREVR